MKKYFALILILILLFCSGCNTKVYTATETFFIMDTVVTISADCDGEVIKEAFELCKYYDNLLSRTKECSDIYKINNSDDYVTVDEETVQLIKKAIYYCDLSEGRFDITICPVSCLYDFKSNTLPKEEDIKKALEKVDYKRIEIDKNRVRFKDGELDLGAIAKGYITDKVTELLRSRGVKRATVNMGGNIYTFGDKKSDIGIREPFGNGIIATVNGSEGTYVTSGIYQRYIEKDGKIYHHIIDSKTGYGVENELSSVTVIGKSSADADALSTSCMLLGLENGTALIESIKDTEAVFILKDNTIKVTSGLENKNGIIKYN